MHLINCRENIKKEKKKKIPFLDRKNAIFKQS